ncbi:nitrous oxide reductase family maturation protein NosD [Paremcibacter congregatus]|uniref:nitrous oxide reductase family maturation protein NosD n=1 Tax=Paremcibacter congregatus TaxID=2043170 RepID=UPI0030ED5CA9
MRSLNIISNLGAARVSCAVLRLFFAYCLVTGIYAGLGGGVWAKDITVTDNLQQAIDRAMSGDRLLLASGRYEGAFLIEKPLALVGGGDVIIQGTGTGNVITVKAPDVTLSGLRITGSGLLLETQDSGIFLSKEATGAVVENNQLIDNLIGVYVWGAKDSVVRRNVIRGRQDLRVNERGNGVQIWNAPGAMVMGNDIQYGRDGIFVTTSKKNIFRDNIIHEVRFAVHYMYTNNSTVEGNISRHNDIGYAIMFSTHVAMIDNQSFGDEERGILFNYANHTKVIGNRVDGVDGAPGPEKCIFIYNSNKNIIQDNLLSGCDIGVQFTAGSEDNDITGNAFVDNRTQVKYVGTRWLEWSTEGRGNYWSDNSAFDLDGNGIADTVYRPNDLTDQILWRYPEAKLLVNSPAVQLLKWAQSAFPALHPGGVVDSAPLMDVPPQFIEKNN